MSGESHALLPMAVELHQARRLSEAGELYRKIIADDPLNFDASHLLGVIDMQEGRLEKARDQIAAALQISPAKAGAVINLGIVYLRLGHAQTALGLFQHSLAIQPDLLDGFINVGAALRQLGRPVEATMPLQTAFAMHPQSPVICNMLGACYLDSGDPHAAVSIFEAGVRADAQDAQAWANLSIAYAAIHEHARALECAQRSIELSPRLSAAFSALGASQFEQGAVEAALLSYETAVTLPDVSDKTLAAYANALLDCGHSDEAKIQLRRAIEMESKNAVARWKLAMANCKAIYNNESEVAAARVAFSQSLRGLAEWFTLSPVGHAYSAVAANQPFFLAYQAVNNRELLSQYGRLCVQWMTSLGHESARSMSRDRPKMRIGFASAHIRDHSVWNAVTKGWIENLDRSKFEIFLFQLSHISDEETIRAKNHADRFEDQPVSLQGWIGAIEEAGLDALIYPEIGMDPMTTQLASLRLAPLQIGAWGHPETTGLPTMDLYLSAQGFEPLNAQENYSERIVLLPNLGVYVEPLNPTSARLDLKSIGLRNDMTLLLCPGTPFKYMPAHDRVWAAIAKGFPAKSNIRLVFFSSPRKSMSDLLERRLRESFDREGVEFDARVCIIPMLDRKRFFGLMQKSALMLDTLGFSGFNTALQGIECGLPVLAREGDFMRGRLASAIMRRLDLPELVATTDETFIQSAIRLASDAPLRKELRKKIIIRRDVLFCDLEPVRGLEQCLTEEIARSRESRLAATSVADRSS